MSNDELEMLLQIKEKENEVLKQELALAHAHIHNLQDAYNECRDWFSNVEFIPETEDLDEYISLGDCDENMAVKLKYSTEEFAMGWFKYWYKLIKDRYELKSLDDYTLWSDKNLDILTVKIQGEFRE